MDYIDIVFDGEPGPEAVFVEVENAAGASISLGEWLKRPDGHWVIRFTPQQAAPDLYAALKTLVAEIETGGVVTSSWPVMDEARAALARAER